MADPDLHFYHNHPQQQQQPTSSSLTRYQSAPSSFFAGLLDSNTSSVEENCNEFISPQISNPAPEQRTFARFISSDDGSEGPSSHNLYDVRRNSSPNKSLQLPYMQESQNSLQSHLQRGSGSYSRNPQMIHQNQSQPPLPNHSLAMPNSGMQSSYLPQMKISGDVDGGRNTNLIRQSSSPAGLFSSFDIGSDFGASRDRENFQHDDKGTNLEGLLASPSKSIEMGDTGFPLNPWDDSSFFSDTFLKELEDNERKTFSTTNASENQNDEGGNPRPPSLLSYHLSLPKNSAELSAMEKFLRLQDSVPCKTRAKRGCATHPRSIAERVRRTRISERMRKLQVLVPNMDKQTNTADMLDLAVDYIKDLQQQFKTLSDNRAKCTCSNQQRQ